MAGTEVGSLYYNLDIDSKNLKPQLDAAGKQVKTFGEKISNLGEKTREGFLKISAGLAVVGVGLTAYAKDATSFTKDFVKDSKTLARTIGVSVTEASRLTAAFSRMGLEAEQTSLMFGSFSKQINAATGQTKESQLAFEKLSIDIEQTKFKIAETTKEIRDNGDKSGKLALSIRELNSTLAIQQAELGKSVNSFQKLGISTVDAEGKQKDFTKILFEVADKFKTMPDGVDKTTIALDLFGRSGKDMIKVLNLGSEGISELEKEADRLGLTLNPTTINAINDLVQSQKDLKQQTDAIKIAVGTLTAPVLTKFNEKLSEVLGSLMATDSPFKETIANVLAFGGPILTATATIIALAAGISTIGPVMAIVLVALGVILGLAAGLAYLETKWQLVSKTMKEWWDFAEPYVLPALKELKRVIDEELMPVLREFWEQHGEKIKQFLKDFGTLLGGALLVGLLLMIANLIILTKTLSFLISVLTRVASFVENLKDEFNDGASSADKFKNAIINAALGPIGALKTLIEWAGKAKDALDKALNPKKRSSPSLLDKIKLGTDAMLDNYQSFFGDLKDMGVNVKPAVAAGATGNTDNRISTTVNIGTIQDRQDADYILGRLDRNSFLESQGLSPMAGA